jgi:hypothetical protein
MNHKFYSEGTILKDPSGDYLKVIKFHFYTVCASYYEVQSYKTGLKHNAGEEYIDYCCDPISDAERILFLNEKSN